MRKTLFASVALGTTLALCTPAVAAEEPEPGKPSQQAAKQVVSEAGITADKIGAAGLSDEEINQIVSAHQSTLRSTSITPLGTADYYSYCEEGSSGLMVWTNNDPKYCYGWYYEYLNGSRISKVNMLRLKAKYDSLNPSSDPGPNLVTWCNNNGFWCSVAFSAIPYVGRYLKRLVT